MTRCLALRRLSLSNLRIVADDDFGNLKVTEPSAARDGGGGGGYLSIGRGSGKPNWTALFALLFKHSSCQQPLVATALARIAEDPEQREAIAGTEGAIQQLLSMVLSENLHVVREACRCETAPRRSPGGRMPDSRSVT
jgi:hypothetical protein